MTRHSDMARDLQQLGFTAYEAMAYISLLEYHPVTRYELSKNSGVPRSAIYNVISRLEELGAVSPQSTEPEKYIPLSPDKLFELLRRRFDLRIEKAQKSLKDYEFQIIPDHLWNVVGYDNMILKARELIHGARQSIYLSVWQREYKHLEKELSFALTRGVETYLHSFTSLNEIPGACIYSYGLDERELEKIWAHKIILITDKNDLMMGEADTLQKKKIIWTSNRALLDIALNHIILDITIYGIRFDVDVHPAVERMQNGETKYLDKLLHEKFPGISFK